VLAVLKALHATFGLPVSCAVNRNPLCKHTLRVASFVHQVYKTHALPWLRKLPAGCALEAVTECLHQDIRELGEDLRRPPLFPGA